MRKIVWALAVLSVGAIMILPMSPAQAAVDRLELECTGYLVSLDTSEGRAWQGGNVFHGRNGIETNRTEGSPYCAGMEIVVGNANLGVVGQAWGTFRYELDAFPGSGFEGTWQVQFNRPTGGEGDEVGKGYGLFEGWQMRTRFQILAPDPGPTDPYYTVSGYVFNPGG